MKKFTFHIPHGSKIIAPFEDAYEKIGTIQRRLAWPLHKDDTLFQSGRPTGLNIYFHLSFFIRLHSTSIFLSGNHVFDEVKVGVCCQSAINSGWVVTLIGPLPL